MSEPTGEEQLLWQRAGVAPGDLVVGHNRVPGYVVSVSEDLHRGPWVEVRLLAGDQVGCSAFIVRPVRVVEVVTCLDVQRSAELFKVILAVDRGYSSEVHRDGDTWLVIASDLKAVRFRREAPTTCRKARVEELPGGDNGYFYRLVDETGEVHFMRPPEMGAPPRPGVGEEIEIVYLSTPSSGLWHRQRSS